MKENKRPRNKMLGWKVPIYLIFAFSAVAIYGINYTFNYFKTEEQQPLKPAATKCINPLSITRETDYHLTHPILLADAKTDDKKYDDIKKKIENNIAQYIKASSASNVSVYYCNLNDGSLFNINSFEKFSDEEMAEITKMIAILKQSEKNPALLEKKVQYQKKISYKNDIPKGSTILEDNKSYSIANLMKAMFANDDENASTALNPYIDTAILKSVYAAIQEPYPGLNNMNSKTTVSNSSKLLKILYNVGFLTETNCETALRLVSDETFRNGILKPMGKDIKTVHLVAAKDDGSAKEIHEFAIIYLNNKNYLLNIMAKGADEKKLEELFSSISKIIYDEMNRAA